MKVSGIFKVLIVVVACVVIGALVLNTLLPNAVNGTVGWVESAIKNATGANMDLNGDNVVGTPAVVGGGAEQSVGVGGYTQFQSDTGAATGGGTTPP